MVVQEYKEAKELLITTDCGGSNGYRVSLWKYKLQRLADEIGLKLYIRHFSPGTSKWNRIEYKLFIYISLNWRACPLLTRETVVNFANTKTKTGLKVKAVLDKNKYWQKISNKQLVCLNIKGDLFHLEWNYTINPRT